MGTHPLMSQPMFLRRHLSASATLPPTVYDGADGMLPGPIPPAVTTRGGQGFALCFGGLRSNRNGIAAGEAEVEGAAGVLGTYGLPVFTRSGASACRS